MEEKMNKPNEDQVKPLIKKRHYTPPVLSAYGKLTELTAGGIGTPSESAMPIMGATMP